MAAVTNTPWTSITFTYNPPDGSAASAITIHAPEFGDTETRFSQQIVQRSRGGQATVYQTGSPFRQWVWSVLNCDQADRALVDEFFHRVVLTAFRWFVLSWAPLQPEVLRCGASVSGVAAKCGSTYMCGQRVVQDAIAFNVRLSLPDLHWVSSRDYDGLWDLDLTIEEVTYLPRNT